MPETTMPGATGNVTVTGPAPVPVTTTFPVPPAPAPHETFGQRVGDFFRRAEQDAAVINADLRTLLTDHSAQVLDVAGDALLVVKLLAPQDAAAAEAADAFIVKVLSMVESATAIAGKALASGQKTS